jgi:hypothetical protein
MQRVLINLFLVTVCYTGSISAQVGSAPETIAPGEPVPRLVGPITAVPNSNGLATEAATSPEWLPTDHVTIYGARRFGPLYEATRKPPPTDPITGWPVDGIGLPITWVGAPAFRSFYRPWYVPYGYGYGWGYRYPFGFRPSLYSPGFYRPWYTYSLYRPWYTYPAPHWSHLYNGIYDSEFGGAGVLDDGIVADPLYAGCFFW